MTHKEKYKQVEIGDVPLGWTETTLGEVAEPVSKTHGFLQKEEIIFINTGDILAGKFLHKNYSKVSTLPGQAKKMIARNNILFSEIRPINKRYAFIDFDDTADYVVSTKLMVINAKENILPEFLYRVLISNDALIEFQHIAESRSGTFPQITFDAIRSYPVLLPEFKEQRAIAKILFDLDSKIELNNQMNKTLEDMGQTLFKHWFVDFKSTGSFNWQVDELGKHIQFIKGKKPSQTSETQLTGYKPQILIDNLNGNTSLYADESGMVSVGTDEPIMVMDGASSGRVEIGHSGILGSTLAKVIVTSDRISNLFLYYFLKDKEPDINQNTTGTSIPHTDKEKIKRYQCNLPPKDLLGKFNEITERIINNVIANNRESKILIQIRDSILPKLMSGKIRINA